ncbi:AAA family ATPase [Microvirga sp. G4-2]|uniref:AAA family ATPase n=1 Tax=Microvirga sp. G4-2 TaxID=3434467 RepID=UPI00404420B5
MRSENTFSIAARQFVEEHASTKTRRWKETARLLGLSPLDLKTIPGGLVDRWHDKPISEISTDDVYALVDEARRQGIPGIGRRNTGLSEARARAMFSCLSKMFGWLVAHRRTKTNPCVGIPRPAAPPARERVSSDSEIRWFWTACDTLSSPFGPLLKFLLIAGARLNEVARMTRHELSEDGSTWTQSGARTKNRRSHIVVLPQLAREILGEVKVISSEAALVFPTNGRSPVSGFVEDMTIEGIRPSLIILDNLSSLAAGLDENDNSALDRFLRFLCQLRHGGLTVLLVHHANKTGDQRGASRREDLLDTSIKLALPDKNQVASHDGGHFMMEFTKIRGRTPKPNKLEIKLVPRPGGLVGLSWGQGPVIATHEEILRAIATERPRTQAELGEKLGRIKGTLSRQLSKLEKRGLITREPIALTPEGKKRALELWPDLWGILANQENAPF